jgi:hypothetical protein
MRRRCSDTLEKQTVIILQFVYDRPLPEPKQNKWPAARPVKTVVLLLLTTSLFSSSPCGPVPYHDTKIRSRKSVPTGGTRVGSLSIRSAPALTPPFFLVLARPLPDNGTRAGRRGSVFHRALKHQPAFFSCIPSAPPDNHLRAGLAKEGIEKLRLPFDTSNAGPPLSLPLLAPHQQYHG